MSTTPKILLTLAGILLIFTVAACQKSQTKLTPTATPHSGKATLSATSNHPLHTATPTSAPVERNISFTSTPVPQWNNIPLMPGAISGETNSGNYLYTIDADSSKVVSFYLQQMQQSGWKPRTGDGTPENGITILFFTKENETCKVGIIQQKTNILVMLGLQTKAQ